MAPIESPPMTVCDRCLSELPRRDAACVVWLQGEHDLSTVPALSEAMAWVIAVDDTDVVVDLSEVEFMSAATVGVLIRARELLRVRSRSLVVRSPSRCAQRVLELCGDTDLPDSAEAAALTGTAGALATWVPVPATDPVGRHADTSPAEHTSPPAPVRVSRVTAARVPSADVGGRADALAADVASVGAP
jgi:anti-anti-sigma factor